MIRSRICRTWEAALEVTEKPRPEIWAAMAAALEVMAEKPYPEALVEAVLIKIIWENAG